MGRDEQQVVSYAQAYAKWQDSRTEEKALRKEKADAIKDYDARIKAQVRHTAECYSLMRKAPDQPAQPTVEEEQAIARTTALKIRREELEHELWAAKQTREHMRHEAGPHADRAAFRDIEQTIIRLQEELDALRA